MKIYAEAVLRTPVKIAADFTFVFGTVSGATYRVQFQGTLSSGTWTDLRTVTGTGNDITIADPAASLATVLLPHDQGLMLF